MQNLTTQEINQAVSHGMDKTYIKMSKISNVYK